MTETSQIPIPSGQYVQSLARGLSVIRAFDSDHPEMTLSDVARKTGLTRATARRFLLTLVELGYVRTDGRLFVLTARVLELGYSYLSGLSLPEIAQPHLEQLSIDLHESTSASVLDGNEIVYVARVPTRRIMTVGINLGTRFPAYATSMGRVHLAALTERQLGEYLAKAQLKALTSKTVHEPDRLRKVLQQVRSQGYALVDEELEPGLRSIAAPVRDRNGNVTAAINVSAQSSGVTVDSITSEYLPRLLKAVSAIEADLTAGTPAQQL
ncbi:IclR family transcriptional regulator [Arthrobacter castelli]|uniref:IclR family transcriptional regulator n=1 Tax=Arthrobacter castelli TaxID=271431 RepID=UPI000409EC2B|nr:IclR family transcriptional regulator [Arthrobacter castelli]